MPREPKSDPPAASTTQPPAAKLPPPIAWPEVARPDAYADPQTHYQSPGTVVLLPPDPPLQPLPSMPLYQIDRELMELIALRDELDAETGLLEARGSAEPPTLAQTEITEHLASIAAVESRIAQYMQAARAKTDAIAYTIREMLTRADIEKQESTRHLKRSNAWNAQAARLKDYVLRFMTQSTPPLTRLETPANRLRVQNNGGVVPLDIYAAREVPDEYRYYEAKCGYSIYAKLVEWADAIGDEDVIKWLKALRVLSLPDDTLLRNALAQSVICPACNGVLDVINGCGKCAGRGTVPAEIPGARLVERGKHLRVE